MGTQWERMVLWFHVSPLRILPRERKRPPFGSALLVIPSFLPPTVWLGVVDNEKVRCLVRRGGALTAPHNPFRMLFLAHSAWLSFGECQLIANFCH